MEKHESHHHHSHDLKATKATKVYQQNYLKVENVDSLSQQMSKSGVFNGGSLGKAIDILEEVYKNKVNVMVGLAGAMIPSGMRRIISQAIKDGYINSLTTTGANITHDLIEAFGGKHVRDIEYQDDIELRLKGIDRIYDSFVAEGSFEAFEDNIKRLLIELMRVNSNKQLIIAPSEILKFIGSKIKDEESIVRAAYKADIPIFVPAISDSVLGLQLWLFSQFNKLIISSTGDLGKIQDVFHDSNSNCALLLGGGVPKNYTLQAALMASKQYDYAIQITMDRVETGGLSGASLSEAISWGKLEPTAKTATIISDLTIALPIIFSSLHQRLRS